MDKHQLSQSLAGLPLGAWRYHEQVGSTNDEARRWAEFGAPDLSLVVAEHQTSGRGRQGRRWLTPPGAALAFSLVLREAQPAGILPYGQLAALGALAVCQALETLLPAHIQPQIKWPNDVLLVRRKIAGILAEATWIGDTLSAVILGIGVNVTPASLPPPGEVLYPAAFVEAALEKPVQRPWLLRAILERLLDWRSQVGSVEFMQAWQSRLAFIGESVLVTGLQAGPGGVNQVEGRVAGLAADGSLRLQLQSGEEVTLQFGEVGIRPVEKGLK